MADDRPGGSPPAPLSHYAPQPNALERLACAYFKARTRASGEPPLTDDDRAELARMRNRAVLVAALSGTISGLIIGGLEIYLRLSVIGGGDDRGMLDDPWIWTGFYAFVGVLTVLEVMFLCWMGLAAISRTREVIGIAIKRKDASELVETGLARGALEIPNPHTTIYGVDPYELMPRWKLLVWNILYRSKVGATSVVLRILMRRVLARAILRGYIPLLAVPLYAGWNAFIIWRVMQEARLRALGPFAVSQAIGLVSREDMPDAWQRTVLFTAAEMIRRSGDAHPNYALLLSQLLGLFGREKYDLDLDWRRGQAELAKLGAREKREILQFMTIVAILAGKPNRNQKRLLREAHEVAGMPYDADRLPALRKQLLEGRRFQPAN